jgi:hypothetical protein
MGTAKLQGRGRVVCSERSGGEMMRRIGYGVHLQYRWVIAGTMLNGGGGRELRRENGEG